MKRIFTNPGNHYIARFATLTFITAGMKMRARLFITTILLGFLFLIGNHAYALTYFSQGSLPVNVLASWNTNPGGGGANPVNFTSGDIFIIQNGHAMTTTAPWNINGSGAEVQVQNGGSLTNTNAIVLGVGVVTRLWIQSGGTVTANASITIPAVGSFQIDGGGTYNHNNGVNPALSIFQGTENFAPTSNFVILATANTITGCSTFGNLTINHGGPNVDCNGSITTINGNLTVTSTGAVGNAFHFANNNPGVLNLTIAGNYVQNGGIIRFVRGNATNPVVTINGNMNINGGTTDLQTAPNSIVLNLGGNFNQTAGTFQCSSPSSTFHFTGNGKTYASTGGVINTANIAWEVDNGAFLTMLSSLTINSSFIVRNNGILFCGPNVISGGASTSFDLQSGGTLGIGSATGIATAGALGNIQTNTRTFSTGASYDYNGTNNQVSGNALPATVHNLTISNTGGIGTNNVVLGQAVTTDATGIFTMANGMFVTTGANMLTVSNNAVGAVSAVNPLSWVNGPMRRALPSGSSVSSFIFPVGTAVTTLPFTLSNLSGMTNPVVQVQGFGGPTGGTFTPPLSGISNTEYWEESLISGTYGTAQVTIARSAPPFTTENVIATSPTLSGTYTNINGSVSAPIIFNSDPTGVGFFVMATVTCPDGVGPSIFTPAQDLTVECDGAGNSLDLNFWLGINGGANASDPCGPITWTNDFTALSDLCGETGAVTVTFTATDNDGSSSTTTATFTIVDSTPPSITCAPDDIADNDQGYCSSLRQPFPPVIDIEDCGGIGSVTTTSDWDFNNPFPVGTTTVTWTAMDACGNSETCTYDVVVNDVEAPHVAVPNNWILTITPVGTSLADEVSYSVIDETTTNTVASGGGFGFNSINTTVINLNTPGPFTFNISTEAGGFDDNVATWTITCNGNIVNSGTVGNVGGPSETLTFTGILPCTDIDTSFDTDAGVCTYTNTGTSLDATVIENCLVTSTTYTLSGATTGSGNNTLNGIAFNAGTTTITWTVVDNHSNSSVNSFDIVVTDNEAPVLTCAADTTINCEDDNTPAGTGASTATDNCDPTPTVTFVDVTAPGSCPGNYTITRTWTATDDNSNSSTCVQTIIVQDITIPSISCPSNTTINCQDDTSIVALGNATATDNCDVSPVVNHVDVITPGTCPGNYTITRTFTATDNCNNSSTCVQVITVQDVTNPTITSCPSNITINCEDDNTIAGTGNATATDNCDIAPVVTHVDVTTPGTCPGNYTITRTFTATDNCNNSSTCIQVITVQDVTNPTITSCPGNITVNCQDDNSVSALGNATATDNCDVSPIITNVDVITPGSCPGNYTITRTFTATDNCNNSSTCVQVITVQDVTNPTITSCPSNITINCEDDNTIAGTGNATATDNCDIAPVVTHVDVTTPGTCPGNYTITRTFTATDNCNNSSTCVQVITVQDVTNPTITSCPSNVTINCEDDNTIAGTGNATATDNCDISPVVTHVDVTTPGTCPGNYTITRTFTATDNCNNSSTCIQVITVQDVTNPTITSCPSNVTVNCEDDNTIAGTGNATATDNCDIAPVVTHVDVTTPGTCPGNYTITRTFTATDNCNNSSTCVQVITVQDVTNPTITSCPGNITVNCQDDNSVAGLGNATATDNCDIAPVVTNVDVITPGTCPGNYTITRTFTATDNCNNSSTCVQVITVQDVTNPTITSCPGNITVNCQDDNSVSALGNASATDNCDVSPVVTNVDVITPGSCPGNYTITRTFTATDNCNNSSTCVQVITVQDITNPTITSCPTNVTVNCEDDNTITGTGNATATDNCDIAPVVTHVDVITPGTCPGNYTITRTFTATDNCNNSSTCVQVITVQDITNPTITSCPSNVTINCEDDNTIAGTGNATATDNCDISPVVTHVDVTTPGSCPGNYTITRTFTATDNCNNSSTCVQVITVQDVTNPTITSCPGNITVNCEDDNSVAGLGNATATDNCDIAPVVTNVDVITPGSCPGNYTITRTFTATDNCNNSSTCVQVITVQDVTNPTITSCPGNITVNCEDDNSIAALGNATATDNCDVSPVVTNVDVITPGTCPGNYTITRTFTATDNCNNSSTCVQVITVQDVTNPTITSCPGNITVNCEDDNSVAALGSATATDNCDASPVINHIDIITTGSCMGNFTITRTFTATDNCNNSSTCVQVITVQDITDPVISCPSNVTINCEDDNTITGTGNATATDNCDITPVVTHVDVTTPGTCPGNYTITRTFTATDNCNNSSTCVQVITVQDVTNPTITSCPSNVTVNCEDDNTIAGTGNAIATDNCDVSPVVTHVDVTTPGTCPGNYTITRTFTATDNCNNSSTCVQVITVQDITNPTITSCPGNITVNCQDDNSVTGLGNATATDNCDIAPVVTHVDVTTPGTCPGNYTITRTFTATDNCNNSSTCVQVITVQDVTNPAITSCPGNITVNCEDDNSVAALGNATATDNCDASPVVTNVDVITPGSCPGNYTITRTFTATDNCNNSSTCVQVITVQDITNPTITSCPGNITVNCEDDNSVAALGSATATDNCDASPVINHIDIITTGSCMGNFTITRTFTATDNCNNSSTCIQVITVQDITNPTITFCPSNVTVNCEDDNTITGTGDATATDNCDISPVVTHVDVTTPGTCPGNYTITRTFTATDNCNNSSTCVQVITVQDVTNPTITFCPPDATINCEDDTSAISLGDATATDNCDVSPTVSHVDLIVAGSCANNYTITRTFTAIDNCNNSSTCVQTITVQDITPPSITCAPDDVADNDLGFCRSFRQPFAPLIAFENCGGATTTTSDWDFNNPFPVGTTTVTWTVEDACGNSETCTYDVIITDAEAPHVALPNDWILTITPVGSSLADEVSYTVIDETTTNTVASGGGFGSNSMNTFVIDLDTPGPFTFIISTEAGGFGDNIADWTLTCNGNTINSGTVGNVGGPSETLTFTGIMPCTDVDTSFDADPGVCTYTNTGTTLDAVVIENCLITSTTYTLSGATTGTGANTLNGVVFNAGTTTITWTSVDNHSNSSSGSFDIIVTDNEVPVLTCAPDITINCEDDNTPTGTGASTAIDNCDPTPTITFVDVTTAGSCPGNYTITRTWTATDNNANSATCVQVINVQDITNPTITLCPSDITVNCEDDNTIAGTGNATATDNCDISPVVTHVDVITAGSCAGNYTITRTFTATDNCNNSSTCVQVITVQDITNPTITSCPGNITVNCEDDNSVSALGNATATDNCDASPVVTNVDVITAGSCAGNYTITRTFTATDNCNNSSTCVQVITVQDVTDPVISCPSNVTVNCEDDNTIIGTGNATATDNCDASPVVTNVDVITAGSCAGNYTITRTFTATDNCNNSSTCVQVITVQDITNPVISCPSNVTVNCEDDNTIAGTGNATATDNCDVSPVVNHVDIITPGTCPGNYTITRTFTATDNCNNSSTCVQVITVQDVTNPTITSCPGNITVNCEDDNSVATLGNATATDNCDASPVVTNVDVITAGSCAGNYTITRTFTATDNCNNSSTCVQVITVQDVTNPTITSCPSDITVNCEDDNTIAGTGNATATDNCDASPVVTHVDVITPGSCANNYTITRTFTATDNCNNSSTCVQVITVQDVTDPTITFCPGNISVLNDPGLCSANIAIGMANATDNCGAPVITNDHPSATYPVGTTIVTWTATDLCGNTAICTQTITVTDNEDPTAICQTFTAGLDSTGNLVVFGFQFDGGSTDNCGIDTITVSPNTFDCSDIGLNAVTVTVTDLNGNLSTCATILTVQDNIAPVAVCNDITIYLDATGNAAITTFSVDSNASFDNCAVQSAMLSQTNFDCSDLGANNVTLTVTDVNGNSSVCTSIVTVADTLTPTFTFCPSDITDFAIALNCGKIINYPTPTFTDNCSATLIQIDSTGLTSGQLFPVGVTQQIYVLSDGISNVDTCSFTITIIDNQPPAITNCPSNIVVSNDAGQCNAVVNWVAPTASDNCPGVTMTSTNAPGSTFPIGVTTVTYNAVDASGNTAVCTFTVTVNDTELPVLSCPADIVTGNDPGSCDAIVNFNPSVMDNCAGVVVTQIAGPPSGSAFPVGSVTTITFQATDASNNSSTCTFTVTVNDTEIPTIVCPGNIAMTNGTDTCGATVFFAAPTTGDNCPGESLLMVSGLASGSLFPVGVTNNIFMVTDAAGNSATCSFTVTITDTQDPSITCAADTTTGTDPGSCTSNIVLTGPVVSDNCSVASVTNDHPSTIFTVGTTVVTWFVTDVNGNTNTCVQNVTVSDDEDPIITCPSNISTSAAFGLCNQNITTSNPLINDNCGVTTLTWTITGATTLSSPLAGINNVGNQNFNVGVSTVTYTSTDGGGNTATCSFTVTVIDNQNPTITCAPDQTQNNDAGVCNAAVTVVSPGTADNCSIVSVINNFNGTNDASGTYPVGTTTVIWTATDGSGNTATCIQLITVNDNEVPTMACPSDQTQTADAGLCSANVTVTGPTATADNCAVASLTNNLNGTGNASGVYPVGTTTVTWTLTDVNGNTSTCTQLITVTDDEDPSISCPADITIPANFGVCNATGVGLGTPTTADNCGVAIVTNDHPSTTYALGTTVVTWTITDIHGNSSTCLQNVTVTDNQNPTITCASDQTQNNDAGVCNAAVTVVSPGTADNCSVVSVINNFNGTNDASGTYPVGTTTVIWTATDGSGNTATCIQLITVNDNEVPTMACPSDQTQTADAGLCSANVTVTGPTATADNCAVASLTNNLNGTGNASGVYPVGTTTVTWTLTDVNGNTSTCTQLITVTDDEDPSITCPSDINIPANFGACSATGVFLGNPTASDNCGITSVTNDHASTTYPVGTTSVTWTVTDINGNTTTCIQLVTVVDNQNPIAICGPNVVQSNDPGVCNAAVTVVGPTTSDNCAVTSVINDFNGTNDASGTYPVGTTTVIWTITDLSGNTTTCSQTVTVNDTELPTIACGPNVTISNDPGLCSANVTVVGPTPGDNCGVASIVNNFNGTNNASGTYPVGTTTVIWTITDVNGNTNTCTQTITVNDTEAPVANCNNITVNTTPGLCGASVNYTVSFTENCPGATVVQTDGTGLTSGNFFPVGTTVQTYLITDASGNSTVCNFTVTVVDNQAPLVVCPSNISDNNDPGLCGANITMVQPVYSDNCNIASVVNDYNGTSDGSGFYPVGTTVVVWTVTDVNGNSSTCSMTVVITDNELPAIACAPDQTQTNDPGVCNAFVTVMPPMAGDNCGILSLINNFNGTSDASGTYPVGTTTIIWTATDVNGNTNTCTQDITVTDNELPSITCAPDQTQTNDPGVCGANVIVVSPGAADNCGILSMINDFNGTSDASGFYPVGSTNVTWTTTDVNGNTQICVQVITVTDDESPVADLAFLPTMVGQCSATVPTPTATDNCDGTISGTTSDPITYTVEGTYVVTWTYTDGSGNTTTQTQTVIIDDTTAPVPTVDPLPTVTAECNVTVTPPTAMDNCLGVITATTSDPLTYTTQGTFNITWTYDDGNGNTTTQIQTVIVDDITAPVADIASLDTIEAECSVTVTPPTATDNCVGAVTATTTDPVFYSTQGTFTIDWVYDDGNGNTSTQQQVVVIDDVTAPVADLDPLPPITGECNVTIVTNPTATDNCSGVVLVTTSDPLTYTTQGTFIITWTYDDGNGNTSTQTQQVIVDDVTAPVADVSPLPTINGQCNVTISSAPTATDNCVGTVTGTTTDPLTYSAQGTYMITWTYDDGNGNTSTQTQTVVIDDVTAPVADVAPLPTLTGECSVTVGSAPTATDNCNGTIVATTLNPLTYTSQGTYTITWMYNDGNGNTSTQTQTIVVDDITSPVPDTATLATINAQCSVTLTPPTATDNCTGSIVASTFDPLSYSVEGTYTVTWIYFDGNGNTSTQTQTVIVDDNIAPVPNVSSLPTVTGTCSATVSSAPTATDNCSGTITGTTSDPLTYSTQGSFVITWTYTDVSGNTSTQTQTVIVDDIQAPVPDASSLPTVNGTCSATVSTTPTASDNCAGSIVGTTTDPLTYSNSGTYTITWVFDDGNGNITTQTQTVIVSDNIAPVPNAAFLQNVTGNCAVTVFTAPTATDNCAGSITGTTTDAISYNVPGNYTITWVFDDGNGNVTTQNQTVIVYECLGVDPSGETLDANIYPNPSEGVITIELSSMPDGDAELRVMDQLGQVVYVTQVTGQIMTYDFSYLRAATYYVQVLSSNGNFTKTIIITHKY